MGRRKNEETGIKRIMKTAEEYGMNATCTVQIDEISYRSWNDDILRSIKGKKSTHIEIDA